MTVVGTLLKCWWSISWITVLDCTRSVKIKQKNIHELFTKVILYCKPGSPRVMKKDMTLAVFLSLWDTSPWKEMRPQVERQIFWFWQPCLNHAADIQLFKSPESVCIFSLSDLSQCLKCPPDLVLNCSGQKDNLSLFIYSFSHFCSVIF